MDGSVEVDLNPATAPAASLKVKNGAGAAYAGGTCGNAYCHSGQTVTSGAVGNPLTDGGGNYILDSHGNFTYAPYTVTFTRNYQATPNWVGGSISGLCTDCHAFPLTTSVPAVQAGVGDTHQWVDNSGYGNLHAYNMGYSPLQCNACHYGEITATGATSRNGMDVTTYSPVPIDNHALHANGSSDVTFTTAPVIYNTSNGPFAVNLSVALYDPSKKACGNVGCHLGQNYVVWGTPYRWWTNECDLCHRYYLPDAPTPLIMSATWQGFNPANAYHKQTPPPAGVACQICHGSPHQQK
jgi:hypothetical protein